MTSAIVLASGVQGGRAKPTDALVVALVIAMLAVIAGAIYWYLRKHPRKAKPVRDQWQALVVMGELCPHGWDAQIKLYRQSTRHAALLIPVGAFFIAEACEPWVARPTRPRQSAISSVAAGRS